MKNSLSYKIVTQVICVILLVILVFPLYLMVEKSLAVNGLGNYTKVFEYFNLLPNIITSIIVVGGTLIVVSIVVSMAAYAFSKLEFPHKQAVYYLILTGMMIPTSALIFPLYQIVRGLHLNNTGWSLVFPYATASACFNLMVLTNYYNALPDELIDAASIDGANAWPKFRYIMLPSIKSVIVLNMILSISGSLSAFEPPYVITGGTFGTATYFVMMNSLAHEKGKIGLAAAMAVVLMGLIFIVTIFQQVIMKLIDEDAREERRNRKIQKQIRKQGIK